MNISPYLSEGEAQEYELEHSMQTILTLVQAGVWDVLQRIVQEHPELLSDEADALLAELVEAQEEQDVRRAMEAYRTLLYRCRDIGVDAAFAELGASTPSALVETLLALINARSVSTMQSLVEEHPELMKDETDAILDLFASAQAEEKDRGILKAYQSLLQRCREVGITEAFAELTAASPSLLEQAVLTFLKADTWADLQLIIEKHPELLSDEADALLAELVKSQEDQDVRKTMETYCALLHRCRKVGVSVAFEELMQTELESRFQAIEQFIQAETLREAQRIVDAHPELLSDVADVIFAARVEAQADADARQMMQERRTLLQRCREIGVNAAFATVGTFSTIPADLITLLAKLNQPACRTNMPLRIEICHRALEMVTHDENAQLWAELHGELGNSLWQNPDRERAENLECAIHHYGQALLVFSKKTFPEQWASLQNNLGTAYVDRICGKRAENLECAIHYYRQALQIHTKDAFPVDWAGTQNGLGNAYANRICGERAENLECAIHYYGQALQVVPQDAFPEQWAMTQHNLGDIYAERIRGKWIENLECAIAHYERALQVYTQEAFPEKWASTQNGLGGAFWKRICGERAENLERAIHHYEQAFLVYTQEAFPEKWAMAQLNLGNVYADRIRGKWGENLECAIAHYKHALLVYTQETFPEKWAQTQNGLGGAFWKRMHGERAENLECAIHHYEQALLVYTQEAFPEQWAQTQNNLGTVFSQRMHGERAENLECAIAHYDQALQVYTQEAFSQQRAMTQNNLGKAYSDRIYGKAAENLECAIAYYQQALAVYTQDAFPAVHRKIQRNLGNLCLTEKRWPAAVTAFQGALAAGEQLYSTAATPEARQAELSELRNMPVALAYALSRQTADSAHLTEAVETIERNRARWLAESLALSTTQPAGVPDAIWQQFIDMAAQIRELQTEAQLPNDTPGKRNYLTLSPLLRNAQDALATIVSQVRMYTPDFMPEPSFDEVRAALDSSSTPSAIVYLLTTSVGSLALIIDSTDITAVWLNNFTTKELSNILYGQDHTPCYLEGIVLTGGLVLNSVLDDIWPLLQQQMMAPVAARLTQLGHTQAVLIPTGTLSLLPLHALAVDEVIFSFAPSARAFSSAQADLNAAEHPPKLLGVGNPDSHGQKPLRFATSELSQVAGLFPQDDQENSPLYGPSATFNAITSKVSDATYLHFACHGRFEVDIPLNSTLYLAGNDRLTLRNLLGGEMNVSAVRLAVLSACQTGITDFRNAPDEAIGFPAGFLQAGVPGTVSTLWPVVDDLSTELLITQFYRYHLVCGMAPAVALNQAQRWLRDATATELGLAERYKRIYLASSRQDTLALEKMQKYKLNPNSAPFAHPYFWAGFLFSGI